MRSILASALLLVTSSILGCKPNPAPPPAPKTSSNTIPGNPVLYAGCGNADLGVNAVVAAQQCAATTKAMEIA